MAGDDQPHPVPALRVAGVRKRFGATTALSEVSLQVGAGEVHALLGENGAGKSTLMRILAGAEQADGGSMELFGSPYAPRAPQDARRAGVAMIHQELALAPHLTVAENILLGVEPTRGGVLGAMVGRPLRRAAMRDTAAQALAAVGRPELDCDRRVGELGLADRQLVELARAVAAECRLLILDEPTSALSRPDADRLFALVRQLRDRGCAVLWISHQLEEVRAVCDRWTVLRDGRRVGEGTLAAVDDATLIALMAGRSTAPSERRRASTGGEVVLELSQLSGAALPIDATLSLHRGEIVGIAGLVGAGRSDLVRTIFGLAPVRGGRLRVLDLRRPSPRTCWRRGVGFLAEDRRHEGLLGGRSIAENLTLTRLPWRLSPRGELKESARWIARVGIRCHGPAQRVDRLSGGNQQKVLLARLLRHDCDVMLLDEPTRGVDVGSRAAIWSMIADAAAGRSTEERGEAPRPRAVLVTSSSLEELLASCDRIAVMHRGRLGVARPASEWTEHALLAAAMGAAEAMGPTGAMGPGGDEPIAQREPADGGER